MERSCPGSRPVGDRPVPHGPGTRSAATYRSLVPTTARVLEGSFGLIETKALGAAAELGVADALGERPARPPRRSRNASGPNADALGRLLRLLTSLGYFADVGADGPDPGATTRRPSCCGTTIPSRMRDWVLLPRQRLDRRDLERAADVGPHRWLGHGGGVRSRVLRADAAASRSGRAVRRRDGGRVPVHRAVRLRGLRLRDVQSGL